ncbi:MAG: dTDP-4-dehydrorhamnose reductase [Candidatus Omnitrophota bacterium]
MKVLVTGSSGMLGTEVCRVIGEGNQVAGVDKKSPMVRFPEVAFYREDILDTKAVKKIFDRENPDIVIHTAAFTDVDGCEKDHETAYLLNTETVRRIAEISKKNGAFFMFISTDFVFEGSKSKPYVENDSPQPVNFYGKTKWEAEKEIARILEQYVIARTSWLYGENGRNFVDTIILKAETETFLRVVNDQTGCPTYAKDLAYALRSVILSRGKGGRDIFHISNSGWCTWYDFAREILKEIDRDGQIKVNPISSDELARPAKRPGFSALEITKFQNATGHKMRPWQEALLDYIRARKKKE